MQVSPRFRRTSVGLIHYCPGCRSAHHYVTDRPGRPIWTFNGSLDNPTFQPSMRIFAPEHIWDGKTYPEETLCHYFLRDGQIQFLQDCEHDLKGQTVPLPDLPDWMQNDRYGDGNS